MRCGFLWSCCGFLMQLHQVVEVRMCALSNHIRKRSNWWEGVKDKVALEKWREAILRQLEVGEEASSVRLIPAIASLTVFEVNHSPILILIPRSTTYSGTPHFCSYCAHLEV